MAVDLVDTGEQLLFSENFACPDHGVSLPELQPRIFSFNAPHGACPRCTGLGSQQEIDPDLLVPDPSLSIDDGALVPWSVGGSSGFYEAVIQAIADRYEIDTSKPWSGLTEAEQDRFLNGTDGEKIYVQYRNRMGRRRQYMLAFDGIVASLQRRYKETDSSTQRERIEEYMSLRPCPVCKGARLKPEVLAVTDRRPLDPRVHPDVRHAGARVPRSSSSLTTDRRADRPPDREGDPRAADVPRRRRRRLPHARPRGGDAIGRRGAAAAARDADRLAARRRPLHPRRAVDRAPPARQRAADRHPRAAARHRQHRRRRRARRGDDAPLRLARRHGAGRRPARRRGRRRGPGGEGRAGREVGHGAVPRGQALDRGARAARRGSRLVPRPRRRAAQPQGASTSSSRSASSSA